ncbi:hypothetical protein NDU88_000056 [Pleurodeles waltl]|uniref:Uncharacterized protein n=1 Tax=Pleurodeles waltl TaxID=8319 RepID=A0AAV7URZ6_PLEWA|nr:hypothetical protein NDU88_000056 [Pleurodeles waltl]
MCCRCRGYPGTEELSNKSPGTFGVKGAAGTILSAVGYEEDKRTDGGDGEESETSRSAEEQRRTTDTATSKEHGCERRREPVEERPEASAASSAAQEMHRKTSGHAPGEAWHTQVHPETS